MKYPNPNKLGILILLNFQLIKKVWQFTDKYNMLRYEQPNDRIII